MDKFYRETSHYSAKYCEEHWGPGPPKGALLTREAGAPPGGGPAGHDKRGVSQALRPFQGPVTGGSPYPHTLEPIRTHTSGTDLPTKLTPNPNRSHIQSQPISQLRM